MREGREVDTLGKEGGHAGVDTLGEAAAQRWVRGKSAGERQVCR